MKKLKKWRRLNESVRGGDEVVKQILNIDLTPLENYVKKLTGIPVKFKMELGKNSYYPVIYIRDEQNHKNYAGPFKNIVSKMQVLSYINDDDDEDYCTGKVTIYLNGKGITTRDEGGYPKSLEIDILHFEYDLIKGKWNFK